VASHLSSKTSKEGLNCILVQASVAFCGHIYAYMLLSMLMKRTALFLKEQQLEKLQTLSEKTGAPIAELVRRAIDVYLLSRKKELK
jgi:Ribbon-helix-helix domain